MSGPYIRIEGVSKRFGDLAAVDNVSLDIERGEGIEPGRAEAEHVKGIEHHDIADGAAKVSRDGGEFEPSRS